VRNTQQEFGQLISPSVLQSVSLLLAAAETLGKGEQSAETLAWLGRWLRDILLVRVGADSDSVLNIEQLPALQAAANMIPVEMLLELLGDIEKLEQQANRHLNLQLALESILLRMREAYAGSRVEASLASS
jgi:DNA polymerase-3 subunit delta'